MNLLFILIIVCIPISQAISQNEELELNWHSHRNSPNNNASLRWSNQRDLIINEWHLKRDKILSRKYSKEIPVWTSPSLAIVNDIPFAFIGACDQALYALNLVEKKIQWFRISNGFIINPPTIAASSGLQLVFFSSSDRTVYCCEAISGRLLWSKELSPPSNTIGEVQISSPVFHENLLFVTFFAHDKSLPRNMQKGELIILNPLNGTILSRTTVANGPINNPVVFTINQIIHIVICARKGLLQLFTLSDCIPRLEWSYQMPNEVLASPCVLIEESNRTKIFIGSKYGNLIALDAQTGTEIWKYMAGNWIDNDASAEIVNSKKMVFVGSHDYQLYAINADTGELIWKTPLGGEVFSSPAVFKIQNDFYVAAVALNNHLYILNAENGKIIKSYFIGNPIWDHIAKGEMLWGSASVLSASNETSVVFGSYSGELFVFPLLKPSERLSKVKSAASLWISLIISAILTFLLISYLVLSENT